MIGLPDKYLHIFLDIFLETTMQYNNTYTSNPIGKEHMNVAPQIPTVHTHTYTTHYLVL